uniref:Avr9/Cf-9 rapidly elicited protein n=1 Tax=Kalanchoe fedtschenkoi TaxID=63787 RepID=A0A7N0T574_KALFE
MTTKRLLLLGLGRAISKTCKLVLVDLEFLFRQGNTLAGKALHKLLKLRHSHHTAAALTCRPYDADDYLSSFISPRDYQFSCSSSPVIRRRSRSNNNHHCMRRRHKRRSGSSHHYYNGVCSVSAVLDLLNKGEVTMGEESPEVELPGFGKSPAAARQLRVTDSPFSLREEGGCGDERSGEVDKAAEEFIDRFYKELKMQRKMHRPPSVIIITERS